MKNIIIATIACMLLIGCAHQKLYPVPPTGWVLYCQDNPDDPGCADYTYLDNLNSMVNGDIEYEPEPVGQEVWVAMPKDWRGDCEDYALTKRAMLLKSGWSTDRLHLATCITERGYSHVVLICEVGQRWMVLDNRNDTPTPFEDVPYRWLAV